MKSERDENVVGRLPQKDPFLFVDKMIEKDENSITTCYTFSEEDTFFAGHFPDNPIVPGVILQEATFQSGALFMSYREKNKGLGVVTRVQDVKFKNFVKPGDTIVMKVKLDEIISNAFYMSAKTYVNEKLVMAIKFTGASI